MLVLLVSSFASGQTITENQRHLTVARLGGSAAITHHVYQAGLSGITYHGNYHNLRSEADTYMRITNTGLPTGNELRIGTVDYSTTNAYVESLGETFREANRDGGRIYIDQNIVPRNRNHQFFTPPNIYPSEWDQFHPTVNSDTPNTFTGTQQLCSTTSNACISRSLTITVSLETHYFWRRGSDSEPVAEYRIAAGITNDADAIAEARRLGYASTIYKADGYSYSYSWTDGAEDGISWLAGTRNIPFGYSTTATFVPGSYTGQ